MQYVRPIDFDSAENTGDKGYNGENSFYGGETRTLIATVVPAGRPPSQLGGSGGQEGPQNDTSSRVGWPAKFVFYYGGRGRPRDDPMPDLLAEEGRRTSLRWMCAAQNQRSPSVTRSPRAMTWSTHAKLVEKTGRRCITVQAGTYEMPVPWTRQPLRRVLQFGRIDAVCRERRGDYLSRGGLPGHYPGDFRSGRRHQSQRRVQQPIRSTAPHLIAAGGGSMVLTSSSAGPCGAQVPYAHYVASKHGVVGLTKGIRGRTRPNTAIRVNSIHPTAGAHRG